MRNILFLMLIRFWKKKSTTFRRGQKGHGLSIIIPFRRSKKYPRQDENFRWVQRYWKAQLPGAEIIIGKDRERRKTFSKSVAVNDGVSVATGDILVIVDVDCYIDADVVLGCAEEIRRARRRHQRLWYVPYRRFFRLTDAAAQRVLDSDPCYPYQFPTPPKQCDEDSTGYGHHNRHHRWSGSRRGHWYGAMIQVMPREAFEAVGGWDPTFRGWGGEDHSAMRAMDTLYWWHKTTPNQVLHLWHPMLSKEGTEGWVQWSDRLWEGQPKAGTNGRLAARYSTAFGNVKKMRALVNEGRGK
jgi:glycosyltransferase involved in cell wall biosynthesis